MNRFSRRAAESVERKSGKQPHQSQSFAQLVGRANTESLKPFIVQVMGEMEQGVRRDLARQIIEGMAPVQTRLMVLEQLAIEKLGETNDSIAERVLNVEDEATGYVKSDQPAQVGDFLRVTFQIRVKGQEKFSSPNKIQILSLAKPRSNPATGEETYQTYENLEKALIGAQVGDMRETEVEIVNGEVKVPYTFKVTVDRISRSLHELPSSVEANPKEEAAHEPSQDAQ